MQSVQSTSYRVWKKIDEDTSSMQRNGRTVPDHKDSAKRNFKEAGSDLRSAAYGWGAVFTGQAIMGGGNPRDRVARAEGFEKVKVAVVQHGSNALMATFLTPLALAGSVINGLQGVAHGVAGLFQGKADDAGTQAAARGVNNLRD